SGPMIRSSNARWTCSKALTFLLDEHRLPTGEWPKGRRLRRPAGSVSAHISHTPHALLNMCLARSVDILVRSNVVYSNGWQIGAVCGSQVAADKNVRAPLNTYPATAGS